MNKLILLHGALGSKTQLEPLEKSLSNLFEIHTLNFSGHGGEPFSDSTFGINTFSQELRDFIIIKGLHGSHVFGYSMGGYVALRTAQSNPDLVGKIFTLGTKFDWNPLSAEREAKRLIPAIIEEKIPAFAEVLKKRHYPNDWHEVIDKTREMMLFLGHNPILTKSELLEITNDCIVARGDEDEMVTPEETEWASNHLHFGQAKTLPQTKHPIEKVDVHLLSAELTNFFF